MGTDEDVIYREFTKLLDNKEEYAKMAKAVNPYSDGHVCENLGYLGRKRLSRVSLLMLLTTNVYVYVFLFSTENNSRLFTLEYIHRRRMTDANISYNNH